jgi:drug/metabolite transporter (DMT)-like permease
VKPERQAPLIVGFAIVVVSFAAILIRLANVPTAVIAAYRLALSSVIIFPFFMWKGRRDRLTGRQIGLCSLAGLFLSLHFLFWIESLKLTTVASSVVLVTTSPVFAAVFAWIFLRERVGRRTVLAAFLCIAGSLVIGWRGLEMGAGAARGNAYALLGAAAFGAQFVVARSARRTMGFLPYVFAAYTASALILVAVAVVGGYAFTGLGRANYLWLFLLALGPQVFGHSSLNWALKYLPAPKVAISILGEPVGSAILAWVFFSEIPGYGLFAGGALILYGVYLALTERGETLLLSEPPE